MRFTILSGTRSFHLLKNIYWPLMNADFDRYWTDGWEVTYGVVTLPASTLLARSQARNRITLERRAGRGPTLHTGQALPQKQRCAEGQNQEKGGWFRAIGVDCGDVIEI